MKYFIIILLSLFAYSIYMYVEDLENQLDVYRNYYKGVDEALNVCQELADFTNRCEKIIPPTERKVEIIQL